MYNDKRHPGNSNPFDGNLSGGWSYEGAMGDAGETKLIIDVRDYTLPKLQ